MQTHEHDASERLEQLDADSMPSTRRCGRGPGMGSQEGGLQRYEDEEIVTKPWPPRW